MKQKVVIKVCLSDQKKGRSKAMKIAVSVPGVESAALQGPEKDQIEVVGDGIDAVVLTRLLRKNVGPAHLLSVAPVGDKPKPPPPPPPPPQKTTPPPTTPPTTEPPVFWIPPYGYGGVPYVEIYDHPSPHHICSIM